MTYTFVTKIERRDIFAQRERERHTREFITAKRTRKRKSRSRTLDSKKDI